MSGRYDDILRRERPQIPGHPAMPRAARAAQFAPFAALTGYGAVVAEVNRQTEPRADLAEDAQAALQETLRRLAARAGEHPRLTATLLRARRAKERGRLCHGRGRAAPHRRMRAGPGARGRRAHPPGRPLRPRAALERDGNQAVPKNRRRSPGGCAAFVANDFVPDARKSGGAYVTAVGALRRIDESGRALVLEGGARIPLDDLTDLALL